MTVIESHFWAEVEAAQDGLEIAVFAHPAVNLALVHNGVPLVRAVKVRNVGDTPVVDATVKLTLHRHGELLAPAWARTHDGELAPAKRLCGRTSRTYTRAMRT